MTENTEASLPPPQAQGPNVQDALEFLKKDGWIISAVEHTDVPRVMVEFAKLYWAESAPQEARARDIVRELVEHGHCPNCGCDQWNTAGCPICPLMRKAYGVLVQAGERTPREYAAYMEADEINKRNMRAASERGVPLGEK